ncbi:MAG: ATP-dependent DNA helicase Rep [Gammaproteobacteria bacterium 39-13]|nr:UvrD-helicase domain-containing protein [Gammaproteobacteria bacterium]OJV95069.1 MAG: ATP-dependent DNA helicase Rep [Gammaproteobacteria bacterium 39-13]
MSGLNPQQQAAATYVDGPLLVIAGAGSGKTRVITHKISYLIQQCGYSPKSIYAVTFTNKAAREMTERVQKLFGKSKVGNVNVSTFHSLGLNIIKKEGKRIELSANFTLFDTIDSINLLKELSGKIAPVSDDSVKGIQHIISNWKNDLLLPEQALSLANTEEVHLAARFFIAYEKTLRAYNAVDFDDLIALPVKLFQDHRDILDQWQNKIRYLLVDEYQDTNTAQYSLIKLLCGVRGALTVVGDDDQSIYAWRGAKPENIQLLQQDYPQLQVVKLEQNYRSTSTILRAANNLISHNPHLFEKQLWSTLGAGEPIRIIATQNDEAEIERVISELQAHKFRYRLPYCDYAILYRSNHQARSLEQALRSQGIPYQISGGVSFFSRTEIKDLFAYFRLMINHNDDAAFLRCVNTPRRDIGPATLEKLGHYAKGRQCSLFDACFEIGLSEFLPEQPREKLYQFAEMIMRTFEQANSDECIAVLQGFVKDIGYYDYLIDTAPNPKNAEKRVDNARELLNWLGNIIKKEEGAISFLDAVRKMMLLDILDRDDSNQDVNRVQLMTLHAAKGLEFPHVFIIGWEEEVLPHKTSIELDDIHEERRLAYVGMTRAQKTLTLTYTKQRKRFGEIQLITPSRFLEELPPELVEREEGPSQKSPEEQRASGQAHLAALKALLQQEE